MPGGNSDRCESELNSEILPMLQDVSTWKSNTSHRGSERPESRGTNRLRDTVSTTGLTKFEVKVDPKLLMRTAMGGGSLKGFGKESHPFK
jgi:hypothetical protein